MNETEHAESAMPTAVKEQRVSTLVGDRLCLKCHYNLCGQPVLREAHYNMLIVRCPECATVASLQEHPLLGRWATRWAVVLVGLWVLVLLGMWFVTTASLYGITRDAATTSMSGYIQRLGDLQAQWMNETLSDDTQTAWQYQHYGLHHYHTRLHNDWWRTQDKDALLAEAGGWIRVTNWRGLWALVRWSPLLVALGCIWSLLLPHVPRRWLPLWSVGLIALPMVVVYVSEIAAFNTDWAWSIGDAVYPQVGMKVQFVALVAAIVPLCIGLFFGRSLARLLVRAALPPRLRGSLAGLWVIDHLPPPAGARRAPEPR